jgi:hypothetical protein
MVEQVEEQAENKEEEVVVVGEINLEIRKNCSMRFPETEWPRLLSVGCRATNPSVIPFDQSFR